MTEPVSRTESFPYPQPADIQIHLGEGEAVVELVDTDEITVAITPGSGEPQGALGELISRVRTAGLDAAADAVRGATIHFTRGRLVVHVPRRHLSPVPLRVVVRARAGSKLSLTGDAARFTVTGQARALTAKWGTGDLTAESVDGPCTVRAGRGRLRFGAITGRLDVRAGTADVDILRIAGGGAKLTTGRGQIAIGTVEADLALTTGAGMITIADAAAGSVRVKTGPGSIGIGVRTGVSARVDIASRTGSARSDLPVSDSAPRVTSSAGVPLRISAVSSHGDIVVKPAA